MEKGQMCTVSVITKDFKDKGCICICKTRQFTIDECHELANVTGTSFHMQHELTLQS
jgi:hypothetical protein